MCHAMTRARVREDGPDGRGVVQKLTNKGEERLYVYESVLVTLF